MRLLSLPHEVKEWASDRKNRAWIVKARAIAKGLAAVAEVISIWLMLILKRGLNLLADKRERFTM